MGCAMSLRPRHHRSCAGTSTLEFIFILPFLLIVMLIAVELSRALATYNVVVQSTREGARTAVITPALANAPNVACNSGWTNPAVGSACGLISSVPSISSAATNVVVTCATNPCAPGSAVTVTVTTRFVSLFADFFSFASTISWWWGVTPPALLSPSGLPLAHTTVMRYE